MHLGHEQHQRINFYLADYVPAASPFSPSVVAARLGGAGVSVAARLPGTANASAADALAECDAITNATLEAK